MTPRHSLLAAALAGALLVGSDAATVLLTGMICLTPGQPCKLLIVEDLTRAECEFLRAGFVRQRDDAGEPVAWNFHCGVSAASSIVRGRK